MQLTEFSSVKERSCCSVFTQEITKTHKSKKTNRADWTAGLLLWSPGFSPWWNSPITPNCPKQSPERPKLSLCLLNLLVQSLSRNDKWVSITKANSLMQLFNNNHNVSYSQLKHLVTLDCKWIYVCVPSYNISPTTSFTWVNTFRLGLVKNSQVHTDAVSIRLWTPSVAGVSCWEMMWCSTLLRMLNWRSAGQKGKQLP